MFATYQCNPDAGLLAGAVVGLFGVIFCCGVVVILALHVLICYLLYNCFNAIPAAYRKQEPGMVWLLLIPLFHLVWNFFVYPKLAESYQAYFAAQGRTDVGDCGRQIGLVYCILAACSLIPYAGVLTGLGALVLLVIFLVKAYELKNKISTPQQ